MYKEMDIDISLEDLAMGKLPKAKKGKMPALGDKAKMKIKQHQKMIDTINGMSVNKMKMFNETEIKAMYKSMDALQDALYRAKEMLREATPESKGSHSKSMAVGY